MESAVFFHLITLFPRLTTTFVFKSICLKPNMHVIHILIGKIMKSLPLRTTHGAVFQRVSVSDQAVSDRWGLFLSLK
jgi:hypothetical protein